MRAALQGEAYECLPDASGMRIASCRTHEWAASDASGQHAWEAAQRQLSQAGTRVTALDLPEELSDLLQAQKTVMAYEAALHLAYEAGECAALVSQPIQDLVATGKAVQLADYAQAKKLAETGLKRVLDLMGDADAILVPAAPGEAPAGLAATGDPIFSRVWTLLGMPCVNVPGLFGLTGLPVGMQLVGRPYQERRLLACAATLHSALSGNRGP